MIPHTFRPAEFVFYRGQTKIATEKGDWKEVEYMGKTAWAYYGTKTTYISRKKIG
jgi:hypothetical protein